MLLIRGVTVPGCTYVTVKQLLVYRCVCNLRTRDNFTFKCHRSVVNGAGQTQDIYPVSSLNTYTQARGSLTHAIMEESCEWGDRSAELANSHFPDHNYC